MSDTTTTTTASTDVEVKQGWWSSNRTNNMSSVNAPPLPLLALFGVVIFYLYLSTYFTVKEEYRRTVFNLKLLLVILPALLFFMMRSNDSSGRWYVVRLPRPEADSFYRAGGSPWGVGLVLVLLLIMISYHSTFGAQWFRPLWYSHYY